MGRRSSPKALLAIALIIVAWQSLIPNDDVLIRTAFDKAGHALVYLVLGGLAALAMVRPRFFTAWLGIVVFGLMLEIVQGVSGYRSFELLDLCADAVGAALGAFAVTWWMRRRATPSA